MLFYGHNMHIITGLTNTQKFIEMRKKHKDYGENGEIR